MKQDETGADTFFNDLYQMEFFTYQPWYESGGRRRKELDVYLRKGIELIRCLLEEKQPGDLVSELPDKEKNILTSAIEYLTEAFSSGNIMISEEQLPLLLCLAEVAQNEEILPEVFCIWWEMVAQTLTDDGK